MLELEACRGYQRLAEILGEDIYGHYKAAAALRTMVQNHGPLSDPVKKAVPFLWLPLRGREYEPLALTTNSQFPHLPPRTWELKAVFHHRGPEKGKHASNMCMKDNVMACHVCHLTEITP